MKKALSLIMAALMVVAMFAGCGSSGGSESTQTKTTEANIQQEQPVEETVEEASGEKLELVLLAMTLGDAGMNDAMYAGFERACAELNVNGRYIEQGRDSAKYRALVLDACETADLVVASAGYGMVDELITAAQEYPEVKFLVLDCPTDQEGIEDLPNFCGAMCKQNELSFMAGTLAASMTETDRIGMVFGMEYPTLSDFIIGYIAGAQYINPDIKIALSASGSFSDQAAAKETTLAQAQLNVDVVYAVGASSSYGTLEACKEAGVYGIGCDADMAAQFIGKDDEQADAIISSAFKDWGYLIYHWVERIEKGEDIPWGSVEQYSLANDGCYLIENEIFEKQVPDDVKSLLEEIEQKLINGEIECPSYFTVEESVYQDMVASVRLG